MNAPLITPEMVDRSFVRAQIAADADRFAAYVMAGISTEDRCRRGICLKVDHVVHKSKIEDAPWSHELAVDEFERALERRDEQAEADLRLMTDAAQAVLRSGGDDAKAARAAADIARTRRTYPHLVHIAVNRARWRVRHVAG